MEEERSRSGRKGLRKRRLKGKIKLMLLISGVCLAVALIISLMIGNLPSFVERTVSRQIEGEIARTVGKGADIEKLKEKYKKYLKE